MRILTRYILFEYTRVLVLGLTGMTLFMLLVGVAAEAIREGLSVGPVLQILPYILPESMRFSVPAASLLAACTLFGRMSGDNEIVALKAQGISPGAILMPVFVTAFLIGAAGVWVNELAVSWGRPGVSRVILNSVEQIAYAVLRTHKSYSRDGFSITVKSVEGKRLILPIIRLRDNGQGRGEFTITAREAMLRRNPENKTLSISLTDAQVEGPQGVEGSFSGDIDRVISLERDSSRNSPSDCPLYEIPVLRDAVRREISQQETSLAAEAAFSLFAGDFRGLRTETWRARQADVGQLHYRWNRFVTEPWRRWANGFSGLFFVIVGAPLAIRLRQTDLVTTFFMAFMPILIVYYPLMAYGADQAKTGTFPQYSVWLGNAVCLVWGLWILRRVYRY
ncbi:MAG TPA: LptF/LptG family permease [Pirellulaceae bacterium]